MSQQTESPVPSEGAPADPPPTTASGSRRRVGPEVLIVLGLSVGQSAIYSAVSLIAKLTEGPISEATATLNPSRSERIYLDLTYQLLSIAFGLVPVALALYLLSEPGRSALRRLGLDLRRPVRDLGWGLALSAAIGLPGIGLYFAGRALGVTAEVVPSALNAYWWTVPVLILSALKNSVIEEVIAVGYLVERLEQLGWRLPFVVVASALLRGSYHLYQGFGPFVGNTVMGLVFAAFYVRTRRVMPLVVAHTVLDVIAFVGYDLFADELGLT